MASSSGEDVPRGLEFLLSRNRLNVAISRARCLAYLVASPRLLEVNCTHDPADAARERALPVRRAGPGPLTETQAATASVSSCGFTSVMNSSIVRFASSSVMSPVGSCSTM